MSKTQTNMWQTYRYYVIIAIAIYLPLANLNAQRGAKGTPEDFKEPLDKYGIDDSYFLKNVSKKDKDLPWLVMSDRDNNKVYKSNNESSESNITIEFRDIFYVTDEKGEWIEITRPGDKVEPLGWIHKKNMLLHTSGILNPYTKIHQKVLLINQAQHSDKYAEKIIDVFRGPKDAAKDPPVQLYRYFFILKKENNYVLICEEDIFNRRYVDKVIGWVQEIYCADWNTRIALEPNYDADACQERKQNPDLQVHGFQDKRDAIAFSRGEGKSGKVLWDKDPVNSVKGSPMISIKDPCRYNGSFLRFPLLSRESEDPYRDIFKSGVRGSIQIANEDGTLVIGASNASIPEEVWSKILETRNKVEKATQNINICFLIEGSAQMNAFKADIVQAILNINNKYKGDVQDIKYAAALYRGPYEKGKSAEEDRRFVYEPFTADIGRVASFINTQKFASWNDNLTYKAMHYGMSKAIDKFSSSKGDEETNILILIGNFGDYRADNDIATPLKNDETRKIKSADIVKEISNRQIQFYATQCINDKSDEAVWFGRHARYFLVESARNRFVERVGNKDEQIAKDVRALMGQDEDPPNLPDEDSEMNIGFDIKTPSTGRLTRSLGVVNGIDLQNIIQGFFKEGLERVQERNNALKKYIDKGQAIDIKGDDDLAPDMANFLYDLIKKDKIPFQYIELVKAQKFQLYTRIYLPKKVSGAVHPMFKYVLFMPEPDLIKYHNLIKNYVKKDVPKSERRENLERMYWELIVQFTGNEGLKDKFKDMTVSDVAAIVQGVYGEGLELNFPIDVTIRDLKKEKVVNDETIEKLYDRFSIVERKLQDIIERSSPGRNDTYEYIYHSPADRNYFWIPIEDAF